jgi:hypothetical protein
MDAKYSEFRYKRRLRVVGINISLKESFSVSVNFIT